MNSVLLPCKGQEQVNDEGLFLHSQSSPEHLQFDTNSYHTLMA